MAGCKHPAQKKQWLRFSLKKSYVGILRVLEMIHELWFLSLRICVDSLLDSGQYLHFPSPLEFEWESSVCIVLVSMASL